GGSGNDRVLRSFGRYDDTPAEVLLTLDGSTFNRIGNPGDLEANRAKVWDALTEEGRDVPTLIAQTNLPEKAVRKALEGLGDQVAREGRGGKGDAYRYRRPAGGDSMPDRADPLGEGMNPGTESEPPSGRVTPVGINPTGVSTGCGRLTIDDLHHIRPD